MTARCWAGILVACLLVASSNPSWGNGCDSQEPRGPGLAELHAKYATPLAQTQSAALLESTKRFQSVEDDESQVLALLLLHRVLDGAFEEAETADALIPASQVRAGLSTSHVAPAYRCRELKALDEYVRAHGEGYAFAELWGSYFYRPQEFLALHLPKLSKDEAMRARFEVYRSVDPCDVYRFDNGCYGPFFSELAVEAAGTRVHGEVMRYAFEANLNLAACPHASKQERELGAAAARRLSGRVGESALRALSDYEEGNFEPKLQSAMCREFGDT